MYLYYMSVSGVQKRSYKQRNSGFHLEYCVHTTDCNLSALLKEASVA